VGGREGEEVEVEVGVVEKEIANPFAAVLTAAVLKPSFFFVSLFSFLFVFILFQ
jgi:hypothetical protein